MSLRSKTKNIEICVWETIFNILHSEESVDPTAKATDNELQLWAKIHAGGCRGTNVATVLSALHSLAKNINNAPVTGHAPVVMEATDRDPALL